jgi:hypothetical protein
LPHDLPVPEQPEIVSCGLGLAVLLGAAGSNSTPVTTSSYCKPFLSGVYDDPVQIASKETRLALLKDINARVAAAAGVSPDDLIITLYEAPGENFSFGQGEAQRANAVLS